MAEPEGDYEELVEIYESKVKEMGIVKDKLRKTFQPKRWKQCRPDAETLVVKIQGESAQEFPNFRKKRSRSPKRVEIQTEKPKFAEYPNDEKKKNVRMIGFLKNYLDKANVECKNKVPVIEERNRIEQKVVEQNKKLNEDLELQSKEHIAV